MRESVKLAGGPRRGDVSAAERRYTRVRVRAATLEARARAREHADRVNCKFLGQGSIAKAVRVTIVLPVLAAMLFVRAVIYGAVALTLLFGPVSFVALAVPAASSVVIGAYYRPVLLAAQDSEEFQFQYREVMRIVVIVGEIIIWTVQVMTDIINVICPWVTALAELIFMLVKHVIIIFFAVPLLQQMMMFAIRLFVNMIETVMSCAIEILEAFGSAVDSIITDVVGTIQANNGGRRLTLEDISVPESDMLLLVTTIILTCFVRVVTALVVATAPLIVSFVAIILPALIEVIPLVLPIFVNTFKFLASAPVKRIVTYIIEVTPLIMEVIGAVVCGVIVYLGSAACFTMQAICIPVNWIIRYMVGPISCGGFAVMGGCFRSFVYAGASSDGCYSCGRYNTGCLCRADYVPSNSQSCDSTCIGPGGDVAPPPPPVVPGGDIGGNYSLNTAGNRLDKIINADGFLDDLNLPRNSGPDDLADFGLSSVQGTLHNYGTELEECDQGSDPSCASGREDVTYSLNNDDLTISRRRVAQAPGVSPTESPTVDTTSRRRTSVHTFETSMIVAVSAHGLYSSSPGFNAGAMYVFEGTGATVLRLGTLPYRGNVGSGDIMRCNPSDCDTAAMSATVSEYHTRTNHLHSQPVHPWPASDFLPDAWVRVDLPGPSIVARAEVTWAYIGTDLCAPSAYRLVFVTDTGVHVDAPVTAACSPNIAVSRFDSIENPSPLIRVASVMIRASTNTTCSGSVDHTSPLQLRQFTVWGHSNVTSDDAVYQNEGTGLRGQTELHSNSTYVWDPCGSGSPQRMMDGSTKFATILAASRLDAEATVVVGLHDTDGLPAPLIATDVVVHMSAGNTLLPQNGMMLCKGGHKNWSVAQSSANCTYPSANPVTRSSNTGADWSGSEALRDKYGTLTTGQIDYGIVPAPFWDTDAGSRDPQPVRGESVRFSVSHESPSAQWSLVIGPDVFNAARNSTWDAALIETGMSAAYQPSAQWIDVVASGLTGDGRVTSASYMSTTHCAKETEDLVIGLAQVEGDHMAPYVTPWGGTTSTVRRWIGITEVEFIGRRVATTDARRAGGLSADEEREGVEVRREATKRKAADPYTPTDRTHTTASILEAHGSREISATGSVGKTDRRHHGPDHVIASRWRSASAGVSAHPFPTDISQLPREGDDPEFTCDKMPGGNHSCRLVDQLRVAPPDESSEPSSESTFSHGVTRVQRHGVHRLRHERNRMHTRIARSKLRRDSSWFDRAMSRRAESGKAAFYPFSTAVSRRILGAGNPWDVVKDKVHDAVNSAISAFESLVTHAMNCVHYCFASLGCDNGSIGDCVKALGPWLLKKAMLCDNDRSIYYCAVGRMVELFLKMLLRFADLLLQLLDTIGELVGKLTGLGDMMKQIACLACSITSVVSGVLDDFTSNFPIDSCLWIMNKGSEQCHRMDLGGIDQIGAAVFGNLGPIMKIAFGLIQVSWAFANTAGEFAILIFGNLYDIFPVLLDTSFEIVQWFISAKGVIGTVHILIQSLGPMFEDASVQLREATGGSSGEDMLYGVTLEGSTVPTTNVSTGGVYYSDSSASGLCYNIDPSAQPNTAAQGTSAADVAAQAASIRADDGGAAGLMDGSTTDQLAFDMGGYSCDMPTAPCADGVGTGNCPFSASPSSIARAERVAQADVDAAAADPDDSANWLQCGEIHAPMIATSNSPYRTTDSGELHRIDITSRKCYIMRTLVKSAGGRQVDDSTLREIIANANPAEHLEPSWWKLVKPSKQDGTPTSADDEDFSLAQIPDKFINKPSLDDTFRRRNTPPSNSPTFPAGRRAEKVQMTPRLKRHLWGIDNLADRAPSGVAAKALADMKRIMDERTGTPGERKLDLLTESIIQSVQESRLAWDKWKPDLSPENVPGFTHVRRMLGIVSDDRITDLNCAFKSEDGMYPNPYGCVNNLWCAVRPIFPRNTRLELSWFRWRDEIVSNTLCPEMDTYAKTYMFALRSLSKLAEPLSDRTSSAGWPFAGVTRRVWSVTSFPDNNRWPAASRHPPEDVAKFTTMCVALNVGAFVPLIVFAAIVVVGWMEFVLIFDTTITAYNDVWEDEYDPRHLRLEMEDVKREEDIDAGTTEGFM